MSKLLRSGFVKISRTEEGTQIHLNFKTLHCNWVAPITGQSSGPTFKLALPFLIHTSAHGIEVQT